MIQLENVSKSYKNGVHALRNINLTIEDGEFVYIIGPTGSGKSTLIKLLDGEEIPDEGDVIVNDVNVGKLKHSKVPYYRRNIGVVFQDFRLLPALTIFENISFALEAVSYTHLRHGDVADRRTSGADSRKHQQLYEQYRTGFSDTGDDQPRGRGRRTAGSAAHADRGAGWRQKLYLLQQGSGAAAADRTKRRNVQLL